MIHITDDGLPPEHDVDGRSTRWEGHRTSRRLELVHAARRAVHRQGPDLSMEEIATAIGTSKSILYRYFQDKTGLQSAVGQAVLARMRDVLETAAHQVTGPRERIAAMVAAYLELVAASPNVYAFVTRPEAAATAGALRGFVAEVVDLVAQTLLPVIRDEQRPPGHEEGSADVGDADDAAGSTTVDDLALAQLWASGVVGLVRGAAERWMVGQSEVASGEPSQDEIGVMTRDELGVHLSRWLWDGAVGVSRRARRRPAGPVSTDAPDPAATNTPDLTARPITDLTPSGRDDAEPR